MYSYLYLRYPVYLDISHTSKKNINPKKKLNPCSIDMMEIELKPAT